MVKFMHQFIEMARANAFAARPARSWSETAQPDSFILNNKLFSGPAQPVAHNII